MNQKKLHLKFIDQYESVIFDDFISHIDSVTTHTLVYLSDFTNSNERVIRLIERIKHIIVVSGLITITYESGAELQITRV